MNKLILDYVTGNIPQLLTAGVGIGAVWFILAKALKVLKEISELLNAVLVAFADKKLTKDEIAVIVKEAKDIPLAVKAVVQK
ncbi:hypothetical protein M0R36_04305 [bacterium]|jgi:ABC-type uncharacterized transport system permease subunit|nr:hypothetical protein [bacterium]